MAKNATNWFTKINAVLDTIGGSYGKVKDKKTYGVMRRAVQELMDNKALGGDLAECVIQNIAIRIGPRDFSHEGLIQLTKNQRQYARRMGWGNPPSFDELYQRNPQDDALEGEQDDDLLFGLTEDQASVLMNFLSNSDAAQKASLIGWLKWQNEPTEEVEEPEPLVEPVKPAHHQDAITIWVKENRNGRTRATGNLDIAGQKFCLNFMDFYSALESIPAADGTSSWRGFMAHDVANAVLPAEQVAEGVAACSTMSGLWAANDSHARKAPVFSNVAVVLEWEGARPVKAHLFNDEDHTIVDIKQQTPERFKGAVKLAA